MNVSQANRTQRPRSCGDGRDQQPLTQCAQIETPVEAIKERREIARGILLTLERMEATRQTGFKVAQDSVDPVEVGHILGLTPGHDGGMMGTTGFFPGAKAGQFIGEYGASRRDMVFCPCRNGLPRESANRCQADGQRMTLHGQGDGGD